MAPIVGLRIWAFRGGYRFLDLGIGIREIVEVIWSWSTLGCGGSGLGFTWPLAVQLKFHAVNSSRQLLCAANCRAEKSKPKW